MGCIVNCFPECLVDTDLVDCWEVKVDVSWTNNQNGTRHMTQRKCTSLSPGNQKSFIQVCCYIRLHSSHTNSLLLVYRYLWLIVVYRYDTNTPTLFVNCHPYSLLSTLTTSATTPFDCCLLHCNPHTPTSPGCVWCTLLPSVIGLYHITTIGITAPPPHQLSPKPILYIIIVLILQICQSLYWGKTQTHVVLETPIYSPPTPMLQLIHLRILQLFGVRISTVTDVSNNR